MDPKFDHPFTTRSPWLAQGSRRKLFENWLVGPFAQDLVALRVDSTCVHMYNSMYKCVYIHMYKKSYMARRGLTIS